MYGLGELNRLGSAANLELFPQDIVLYLCFFSNKTINNNEVIDQIGENTNDCPVPGMPFVLPWNLAGEI